MSSRAIPMIRRGSLLSSCAVVAIATLAWTPPAAAQLLGTPTVVGGSADVNDPGNITGIAPRTIINWTDAPTTALPSGNTVNYSGTNDYIVLNRILPTDNSQAVRLDGTVNSTVNGSRGGQVWFYSPTGVIAGNGSRFNVGSLLLTANDVTNADFLDGNDTFTFARGNSDAAVVVEPGAEINAGLLTNGNNYVALVAPRVRQAGTVRVEGSAAYVAAEQVDIRISGSLFDISFSNELGGTAATGTTTEDAAIAHEGDTILETGYGTPLGARRDAIMLAVPKNDAVTMLVTGNVQYNAASGASLDSTGRIILSGGYDFTENNAPVGTGAVNIDINGGNFGTGTPSGSVSDVAYDTTIRATGDVTVRTANSVAFGGNLDVNSLGAASLTASGFGNSITAGGTMSVTGLSDASVTAFSGGQVVANGTIRLRSPVSASLAARDNSVISANGGIELDATANGTTDNPNATGGTASVIAENGSSISASYIQADASATGGVDADGNGGSGTGGTASIVADQGGEILANYTDAIANGFGGSSFGGRGGDGSGGSATLRAANGGSINASIETYVYAYGEGGNGSTGPGGGFGGSVTLAADGGFLSAPGYRLDASGTGGEQQTESGYGPSSLGLGQGGSVTIRTTADNDGNGGQIVTFSGGEGGGSEAGGFLSIDASGNGNSFGGEGGGSDNFLAMIAAAGGTGGTINMDIDGAGISTGNLSLDVSGSGGDGLPGYDPDTATAGGTGQGGTINLNFLGGDSAIGTLNLTANGTGGSASTDLGGSGTGGTINLAFQGGTVDIDTARLTADGSGGASGTGSDGYGLDGASGFGGTISVTLNGGSGTIGTLIAGALADGGRGGDGFSSEGRADGGFGGSGTGGTVNFDSFTNIEIGTIALGALGQGGQGGNAAVGSDRIGGFGGGGGTGTGGNITINLARDDLTTANLFAVATGTGGRGGAGDDFFTDDHSYFVISSSRSWEESLAEAQTYGNGFSTGYLAAVNSSEENDQLTLLLSYFNNLGSVWIGGSDAGSEGSFTWRGGPEAGNPIGFTNWAPGQPDNLGGAENYIVFGKNGQWSDASGGAAAGRGFLVEFDTTNFGFNDGTGGVGQGGTVNLFATGSNVSIDTIALSANGIGGEGGANFSNPSGFGGTGNGGSVNFNAFALDLSTQELLLSANGTGGFSQYYGGMGYGGSAYLDAASSVITITGSSNETSLLIEANGGPGAGSIAGSGAGGSATLDQRGGTITVTGSAAVRASQPIDPDGIVIGDATGGTANILVSEGGALNVEQQLLADASAFAEAGLSASGGTALIRANGGTIGADGITVTAAAGSAGNPDFSYGGNASGGTASLEAIDGGAITATNNAFVSAFGRSGGMGVADGRGAGGTINVSALGGTIQASSLTLDATALGSGYTFVDGDITGRTAQGGTVNITVGDGAIGTGQIAATDGISANASAAASESGYGVGSGGDAQGGDINVTVGSGGITTRFLGLYAVGSGGNEGIGSSTTGGNGAGGTITLDFTGGTQSLDAVEANARGTGGGGNDNGEQGGNGGAGTGGTIIIRASGGTGAIGSLDIDAGGFGGNGASSFTTGDGSAGPLAGGRGGDGTGGTITLTASGGATLTLPSYDAFASGFAGSGGNGSDAGYGTGTIGGAGGAGGDGTGGGIILSVNDGTLILGDGDAISFAAEGGGGGGGQGGDGDGNSPGFAGGIGGAGGNGLGGAITIDVVGGAILGGGGIPADLNLRSIGFSGFGGSGGFSGSGVEAGDGLGGNAAGGEILISATENEGTRSNVSFGNADLVSGGESGGSGGTETAGRIRINATNSDIAFGAIGINLFGSDTTAPVAASGFTADGGTISANGPVSVQTPRDFYVDAANGGTTSVFSSFNASVGGLFSSNGTSSGDVPTLQADGIFVNAGDIRTTGDSLLSSTEDLVLRTGSGIAVNALSAGGSILLRGTDGTVPGNVAVASAEADEDVDIDATGNIAAGNLSAGRDVLLQSGGDIQVTTAQAGDDIEAEAAGAVSFASATTTGLGPDLSESGYGAGDGSNIRLAGTTVRLDDGDAVNGIFLTANTGDVNSAGLLRADTLTVTAVTNITLNDLDIVNAIDLTTSGGSITGGDFETGSFISLRARDDVRIGSASAGGFVGLFAGGTASADSLAGGSIFVDAGTIDIGTARAAFDLTLLADGLLTLDDGEAESFFASGTDVDIGSVTTFGTSLSGEGFAGLAIEATGNTTVQNASSATFVSIETGTLDAGLLTAAGDVVVNAAGNVVIQSATAGRDVLLDSGGAITVAAAEAGDDIEANATGAVTFGTATTTGLGEDASESGYGAGDGSNIRLAGSTVRLDTGTAVDGIYLTANTGAVNSAGLLTADTLDVDAATDIALTDLDIGNAIDLATTTGSISGRDFTAGGDIRLDSATSITLGSATTSGRASFLAAGGVTLGSVEAGDIDIAAASLDAGTLLAARDVAASTTGNMVIASATAGRDVLLDGDGAISVVAAEAGDDIEANATGAVTFGTATTTGLGEDASESGYGAGDGSNIRLAGSTVRLDTGTAIDGIYLTANTGAVNSAGLLTADTLDVDAATDIALTDLDIGNAIDLATTTGSISGRDFTAGGDIRLDSATSITLGSATTSGRASFLAAGGVTLGSVEAGDIDIAAASLDAGTLLAARDVAASTTGNMVIASATAGRDVLLDSGGAISVAAAEAGDDIEANATGAVSFGTATTTGLGEDASESGYGAGDGSNIRLAGSTVRLDDGTAIDGIYLTANTGAVDSAGLLTANTLDVDAGTDIALNDASIRQAIDLTTTGGSISGGDFATGGSLNLDSSAGITLASASVSGDAAFTAAGDIALGTVNSGGGITANGANIGLQQAEAGDTIRLNAAENITVGAIVVRGDFLADAGGNFTGTSVTTLGAEGGDQAGAGNRIGTLAIDPDGNGISIATGGNIVLAEGNSAGAILLDAAGSVSAGTLVSNGNLGASGATGVTIGVIDAAGDVDLRAEGGAILVSDDLRATGNIDAAGQAVTLNAVENLAVRSVTATAGDIRLNAGNDLAVAAADASGTFAANAGNLLSFSGTTSAAEITLASRDIAIGSEARIGSAGRTQSIAITANGAGGPVVLGGSGTSEGYRLDNSEFGRLASRDISFSGGDGRGLRIEALDIRGANASDPNVSGRLSITDASDVTLAGAVRFNDASSDNVLGIGSGARFFLDTGSGSVAMTNGSALAGTFQVQARTIVFGSQSAASDLATTNGIAARDARFGRNDGAANLDGYVRAGAIRLAAVDGVYAQNSGANSTNPDERAGLTAGEGGITIVNLGGRPLEVVINGRQVTSAGTITGAALIPRLQTQGGQPGNAFFAVGSTVNGCLIGGGNCGVVIEPEPLPEIIIPVQDVIDRVLDDEDDSDDALTRPPAPNNELIRIVGYPFAPVIDEPVTGAGNDDLWSMTLPGGFDPNLPPSTIDTQVTGSGNDTLINDQTRGSQNQPLVDTPVTGAGNEGPVTQP